MKDVIKKQIEDNIAVKMAMFELCSDDIVRAVEICVSAFKNGKKMLICGNGGSAADSQHIAAELVSSFRSDFMRPSIPAIALTTDSSMLTAYGNDFGFDGVFARQVEGLGLEGDVLIGLTTSGNSKNIVKAFEMAKSKGVQCIGFLGKDGGAAKSLCDVAIIIPAQDTPRIQEGHMLTYHILCDLIEQRLYGKQ